MRNNRLFSIRLIANLVGEDSGLSHATKAGVRYRYYASTPILHGEARTASAGTVSRFPPLMLKTPS